MSAQELELLALNEVLSALEGMVRQHCSSGEPGFYEAAFITYDAEAMRTLAKYGRFKIDRDDGGRYVLGKFDN